VTGDIAVTGTINLYNPPATGTSGDLTLRTSGGIISLASLNMSQVKDVKLTPAEYTYIQSLTNLDTSRLRAAENTKVLAGGGGTLLTQLNKVGGASGGGWLVSNFGTGMALDTKREVLADADVGVDGLFGEIASGGGALGTRATLLDGVITGDRTVGMEWRTRDNLTEAMLLSDVVDITGTAGDTYVLEMNYDQSLFDALSFPRGGTALTLGYYDSGAWVLAGTGDDLGAYAGQLTVGSWGVDTLTQTAWAVLDHNSEYAVLGFNTPAVSEPASLGLLGLALLGLRKRRS
jgi:hypothetical protein